MATIISPTITRSRSPVAVLSTLRKLKREPAIGNKASSTTRPPYDEAVRSPARAGVLLVVALGVLTACSGGEEPVIETARVATGDVIEVVEAAATVTAKATAS